MPAMLAGTDWNVVVCRPFWSRLVVDFVARHSASYHGAPRRALYLTCCHGACLSSKVGRVVSYWWNSSVTSHGGSSTSCDCFKSVMKLSKSNNRQQPREIDDGCTDCSLAASKDATTNEWSDSRGGSTLSTGSGRSARLIKMSSCRRPRVGCRTYSRSPKLSSSRTNRAV